MDEKPKKKKKRGRKRVNPKRRPMHAIINKFARDSYKRQMEDIDLSSKHDFDMRKHLHVMLYTKTKQELKIAATRLDLRVQEIFEVLSHAIIDGDPYIIKMLNEYRLFKKSEEAKNLFSNSDADTLIDILENHDPFGNEEIVTKEE